MEMGSNNDSPLARVSLCLAIAVALTCCSSASAQVAPGNPISAFLFDEGTGTSAGDSFGSNVGTFGGNDVGGVPTVDSQRFPSWQPNSLTNTPFDYVDNSSLLIGDSGGTGLENWVNLGNPDNLDFGGAAGANSYTISAWVSNVGGGTFVSKAGATQTNRQYQLFSNNVVGIQAAFNAYAGGAATFDPGATGDVANRTEDVAPAWVHVALVVDSSTTPAVARFYVDGTDASQFEPGTSVLPNTDVLIGARHADNATAQNPHSGMTAFFYDGRIDEVAFWDTALTPDNIDWLQTNSLSTLAAAGPDGDFDGDGNVDGADFLDWQRNLGDAANLGLWEDNYGTAAAVSAVSSIPEPTSLLLMGLGALSMTLGSGTLRSRRRRR